jgi:arylamine N-acetyltransferase
MQLAKYLERIGYDGEAEPTYECLTAIHRGHAFAIPYENLDVQLGRPLDFDTDRIFDKLVMHPRGGWCYETHILLEWALREIGFDVMQVAAGTRGVFSNTSFQAPNHFKCASAQKLLLYKRSCLQEVYFIQQRTGELHRSNRSFLTRVRVLFGKPV